MHNRDQQQSFQSGNPEQTNAFLASLFSGFTALRANAETHRTSNTPRPSGLLLAQPQSSSKAKPVKEKSNKHALMTSKQVQNVKSKSNDIIHQEVTKLSTDELLIWNMILAANDLSQNISSCDLPSDSQDNATMVMLVQTFADKTLQNRDKTWLMKICEIAIHSKKNGAGNCQEKAFFGFVTMLHHLTSANIPFTLRLASFDNHFILVVNERFLMDPWLHLSFPLNQEDIHHSINHVFDRFGPLVNYFSVDSNGGCISYEVTTHATQVTDNSSMHDLQNCMQLLQQNRHHLKLLEHETIKPEKSAPEKTASEKKRKYDCLFEFDDNPKTTKQAKLTEEQTSGQSSTRTDIAPTSIEPAPITTTTPPHMTLTQDEDDEMLDQFIRSDLPPKPTTSTKSSPFQF